MSTRLGFLRQSALAALIGTSLAATSAFACDCYGGSYGYQPNSGEPYYDRPYYGQTYGDDRCHDRCGYRDDRQRYYDQYYDGYYQSERLEPYRYYNPDYDDEYYDGGDCDGPDCD